MNLTKDNKGNKDLDADFADYTDFKKELKTVIISI